MMGSKLLDTTVLIDLSRGNSDAADFIDNALQSGTVLFVSIISAMELMVGCRNKVEVEKAKQLVSMFNVVHLSPTDTAKAYSLILTFSKSHNLTIPDALIAATAITQQLELATDNERDFRMIPELITKRPY
ncbi:MAG: type II toxin-antitoxin system VapC family toxin [Anaerolineae bacterium]|nr:type II toxin-antitoxin system VapC family toxin [Anaerolineae bacterium]